MSSSMCTLIVFLSLAFVITKSAESVNTAIPTTITNNDDITIYQFDSSRLLSAYRLNKTTFGFQENVTSHTSIQIQGTSNFSKDIAITLSMYDDLDTYTNFKAPTSNALYWSIALWPYEDGRHTGTHVYPSCGNITHRSNFATGDVYYQLRTTTDDSDLYYLKIASGGDIDNFDRIFLGKPQWNISIALIYQLNGDLRINIWNTRFPFVSFRSCYYTGIPADQYMDLYITGRMDNSDYSVDISTTEPTPSPTFEPCNIFSHHFTDLNGEFQDICGKTEFKSDSGDFYTKGERYQVESENDIISFSDKWDLNDTEFVIVMEVRRTVPKTSSWSPDFDIILGPADTYNCQIRFAEDNKLCIYSNYNQAVVVEGECVELKYDIDVMSEIILYNDNDNREIQIYQNNLFIGTTSKSYALYLGRIGGWYPSDPYPADIAIENMMLATNVNITTVRDYL